MLESTSRIVPGAPPPTTSSTPTKKKRSKAKPKHEETETPANGVSPPVGEMPELPDVKDSGLAFSESEPPHIPDVLELKPNSVVEIINKRLKATIKKVVS